MKAFTLIKVGIVVAVIMLALSFFTDTNSERRLLILIAPIPMLSAITYGCFSGKLRFEWFEFQYARPTTEEAERYGIAEHCTTCGKPLYIARHWRTTYINELGNPTQIGKAICCYRSLTYPTKSCRPRIITQKYKPDQHLI